ncbi:MAG: type I restriction enzyme HsdR N-terminal domain-containing protein [Bacteroidales bacterium]|nr:type I restriction enzyme HsdR N-terminal domain-containing protein [Bacteroidales bacterium]MCF8406093.1 type I restriction enzyme HsdR N-terminal domain-containing protein [Bacteroidales bacterium]
MQTLNLPQYRFTIKQGPDKKLIIFDRWRKKYVALTPEEWVRQNFVMFLVEEKTFPGSLMSLEKGLQVEGRTKRTDIVAYNRQGKPLLIVECKAPEVKITESVFDQIVRYNMSLQVNYIVVTNGLQHFCCHLDYEKISYTFLKEIPFYKDLL